MSEAPLNVMDRLLVGVEQTMELDTYKQLKVTYGDTVTVYQCFREKTGMPTLLRRIVVESGTLQDSGLPFELVTTEKAYDTWDRVMEDDVVWYPINDFVKPPKNPYIE